ASSVVCNGFRKREYHLLSYCRPKVRRNCRLQQDLPNHVLFYLSLVGGWWDSTLQFVHSRQSHRLERPRHNRGECLRHGSKSGGCPGLTSPAAAWSWDHGQSRHFLSLCEPREQ